MTLFAQNIENAMRLPFATHNSCALKYDIAQISLNIVRFKNLCTGLVKSFITSHKKACYCAIARNKKA